MHDASLLRNLLHRESTCSDLKEEHSGEERFDIHVKTNEGMTENSCLGKETQKSLGTALDLTCPARFIEPVCTDTKNDHNGEAVRHSCGNDRDLAIRKMKKGRSLQIALAIGTRSNTK